MKKVIAIIPHLGLGGAEELLVQQREWFRSRGIDFEIHAMFESKDSRVMTSAGRLGPDVILSKGKRHIEELGFFEKCIATMRIALFIRSENGVVRHFHLWPAGLLGLLIKGKKVFSFHNNLYLLSRYQRYVHFFLFKFYKAVVFSIESEHRLEKTFFRYIPFGASYRGKINSGLERKGSLKIVSLSRINFSLKKFKAYLLYFKYLQENVDKDINFDIYGSGPDLEELKVLTSELTGVNIKPSVYVDDVLGDYDLAFVSSVKGDSGVFGLKCILANVGVVFFETSEDDDTVVNKLKGIDLLNNETVRWNYDARSMDIHFRNEEYNLEHKRLYESL